MTQRWQRYWAVSNAEMNSVQLETVVAEIRALIHETLSHCGSQAGLWRIRIELEDVTDPTVTVHRRDRG